MDISYLAAIIVGPLLIFMANFFIRDKFVPLRKRIVFRLIDTCIHCILYVFLLMEIDTKYHLNTGWAFWTILYFSLVGLIILIPIGLILKWKEATKRILK